MNSMNYSVWSPRELISVIHALEEALIFELEKQDMTRSDAQGVVQAIVMKAS